MIEQLNTAGMATGLTLVGIMAAACTLLLFPLSSAAASALAWVDDKKYKGRSPMTLWLARLWGYKPKPNCDYHFVKGDKQKYVADIVGMSLLLVVVSFPGLYLAVKFYEIPMGLALLYAIAHTARFARRHKKLFDEHVKDPEAHK